MTTKQQAENLVDDLIQAAADHVRETGARRHTKEQLEVTRERVIAALVGVQSREDVARGKLTFLIEEIIDREGREGMRDYDFAEQVIALAQRTREEMAGTDVLALQHIGQEKTP